MQGGKARVPVEKPPDYNNSVSWNEAFRIAVDFVEE